MELELTAATSVLERTPAALRALLGGLPEPWLTGNEGEDTFKQYGEAVGPWTDYLTVLHDRVR